MDQTKINTYLKAGGTCCMSCNSRKLTGTPVLVSAGVASQDITCDDCDSTWVDTYCLTGVTELLLVEPGISDYGQMA